MNEDAMWGTADRPRIVASHEWDQMHPEAKSRMQHVHYYTGYCLKNRFGPLCEVKR